MNASDDTICAIATAPGGAIGIVRVSGPQAIAIADSIFRGRTRLTDADAYTTHYGTLYVPAQQSQTCRGVPRSVHKQLLFAQAPHPGERLDEALATVFLAPHSYTGEDSVEFSCHGSQYILTQVCQALMAQGCRQAEPGEFTQRAFLNGKMDLAQAEAVADLIATRTRAQHRMAMSQLRGDFSRHIDNLHERLLHLTTLMELELDFADHEELEFADRTELNALVDEILRTVTRLATSYSTGNAIKEGVRVAIVGPTNAGKSTLLNAILHEERAIVSDIHGTTRDTIEDTFVWQGITFRFIDTAGLRSTTDTIERIGIDRTRQTIANAQIVLFVVDAATAHDDLPTLRPTIDACPHPRLIVVNKTDIEPQAYAHAAASTDTAPILAISAKTGQGLDTLQQWVCDTARERLHIDTTDLIVSNQRHWSALCAAQASLTRVRDALHQGLPTDLATQDLRDTLRHLATITHRDITPDMVLQNVWRNFCVGK